MPIDIFNHMKIGSVQKIYLPMFLFEGWLEYSWSCELYEGREAEHFRKTDNANYSIVCPAYEGFEVPNVLRSFSLQFEFTSFDAPPYQPDLLKTDVGVQPICFTANISAAESWFQYGNELINQFVHRKTTSFLANKHVENFNFRCTSCERDHAGRLVLIPFWFVYYNYHNGRYYCVMDGLNRRHFLTYPEPQVNEKPTLNKTATGSLGCLSMLIIHIITINTDIIIGLIILWLSIIGVVVFNSTKPYRIRKRLAKERALRAKDAAQIIYRRGPIQ